MSHMHMEELTKTQIVLLTLFVSFVTSIATGIVTVTLMDQAPVDVTRTIDRVVEKTVETIVPGETRIVERIKDARPSENDLVINAVSGAKPALVTISGEGIVARGGFMASADGLVITQSSGLTVNGNYNIKLVSDTSTSTGFVATVSKIDATTGMAFIAPTVDNKQSATKSFFSSLTGESNDKFAYLEVGKGSVSLGERLIALGLSAKNGPIVELGNVSSIISASASTTALVMTTISDNANLHGLPVLDLDGVLVGVFGVDGEGNAVVYPDELMQASISALASATSTSGTPSSQMAAVGASN